MLAKKNRFPKISLLSILIIIITYIAYLVPLNPDRQQQNLLEVYLDISTAKAKYKKNKPKNWSK